MDNENIIIVECPKCGCKMEYAVISTLHSNIDAYETQQLISGTLFDSNCNKCGEKINLLYELVYYDEDHDAVIYFVREENVGGVYTALELTEELFAKDKSTGKDIGNNPIVNASRKRIVSTPNDLMEKALIFDNGLDDRIIELVKLVCIASLSEKDPGLEVADAYFDIQDGRHVIRLYGDDRMTTALIPDKLYDSLQEDFAEVLVWDDEYLIDYDWATTTFEVYDDEE